MITTLQPSVAYFSMEVGLEAAMPTYAGGLGVLSGDTLRSAADLSLPVVGVTLLHRRGYFHQRLDEQGQQSEEPVDWPPETYLQELSERVTIEVEGRHISLRAWRYIVQGIDGHQVPLYLLDTMLPENDPEDQTIAGELYGGDQRTRLRQEAVLGLGGVKMLRALGHHEITTFHMNEGHCALLTMELLHEQLAGRPLSEASENDIAAVRSRCVFTTHTPVPEGHDRFSLELVRQLLGHAVVDFLATTDCCHDDTLNMTRLALLYSRYINAVAIRHAEVTREMFPSYAITSIMNGVHAEMWTTPPLRELFDRHLPTWRRNNLQLQDASRIPAHEVRTAHGETKRALLVDIEQRTGRVLSPTAFTIGFARRATPYKRADLLLTDIDRLRGIARTQGALQVVLAGKAHPHDHGGKAVIRRIHEAAVALGDDVSIVYLEGYDMELGRALCGGVDLWLNTPLRRQEASGTSGMKAALNGVPSLSVLDGWWIEGHEEGVTGWSVGEPGDHDSTVEDEVRSLYDKLEHVVMPTYYSDPEHWSRIMRSTIARNGAYFNTERMMREYREQAYQL